MNNLCGYECGRKWDEEGDIDGFKDCVSAYHKMKLTTMSHDKEGIPEWVLRFRHFWGYCNDPFEMEEFFSKILSSRDEVLVGKLEKEKMGLISPSQKEDWESEDFLQEGYNKGIDTAIKLIKEQ